MNRAKRETFNLLTNPMLDMTRTTQNATPARVRQVTPRASFQWLFILPDEWEFKLDTADEEEEEDDDDDGPFCCPVSDSGCSGGGLSCGH